MQSLAAGAIGVLIGASVLVSVRLLVLHRRTGAWPELLLGGMLLLSVGVGYPLHIAAQRLAETWSDPFLAVADIAVAVGFSLLFLFTRRVFRPQATWARVLAAAGVMTLLGKALHRCVQVYGPGAIHVMDLPPADTLVQTGPVIVAYVWTASESLRYYGAMRRRARLGLADVAVTDRFLLWGVMGLSATSGVVLNTLAVVLGVDVLGSPWILLVSSITGLVQAVCLVLAFVPPRAYLGWVRARAAAAAD